MKTLLNTIYVTTENASLRKDGENIVVSVEGQERARAPMHMIGSLVTFGAISLSPALIGACAAAGISVALLDRNGRFLARIEGPTTGNVLLRRAQYRLAEIPDALVRALLVGKIANQRAVLMRALRDYGELDPPEDVAALRAAGDRLALVLRRVEFGGDGLDAMRGAEGEAAHIYFSVFDKLIRSAEPQMRWSGRSRRPPLDAINALLSFLYALLTHECRSAAEAVGLDPSVGFLHRDRPGRPSLALDLMEELRPPLADRMALSLVNRGQVKARDFEFRDGGAVSLSEEGRRAVIAAWQARKKEERTHPFLQEKAPIGLFAHLQALMLARHLRGDLDGYPPLIWT